jgi:hypothetical protein
MDAPRPSFQSFALKQGRAVNTGIVEHGNRKGLGRLLLDRPPRSSRSQSSCNGSAGPDGSETPDTVSISRQSRGLYSVSPSNGQSTGGRGLWSAYDYFDGFHAPE